MSKPFSVAFKQKMVQRLTGKNALSASQLARETGVRQQNLSRWLQEARSLPIMVETSKAARRELTIEQKATVLAEAANLDGEALTAYLGRKGVKLADYEQWRIALDEGGRASTATNKRIRQLERELATKLLEAEHGERLDTGAKAQAIGANQAVETVGVLNGTTDGYR